MRIGLAAAAALMAFALAGVAHGAGTKTVKDWTAVCDNLGDCQAFGFSPEDAENEGYLIVKRRGGGDTPVSLTLVFDPGDTQPAGSWRVTVDGKPVTGVGPLNAGGSQNGSRVQLPGAASGLLLDALKNGKSLEVASADGKAQFTVSLAGSSAVLLWLDDQQGRIGTVTALIRAGGKPASDVPPRRAAPAIAVAAAVSQAGLPKQAPKSMIKVDPDDCDPQFVGADPDDIVARLAPGVVLWAPECNMAAYNESTIMFLGDEHAGHLLRLKVPEAPGAGQATDDFLINAEFDAKTQTLSQFSKGRGIGDCGETARWVWNGKAFVVLGEEIMPECRGVILDDWPPLFVGKRG